VLNLIVLFMLWSTNSTYTSFFGAIFGYPIGFFFGRKRGLLISSLVFIIGTSLMLGATGSRGLNLIYIGRVIAGMGIGCASNLTPIYISEASNFCSAKLHVA
jgi:MFS family permease